VASLLAPPSARKSSEKYPYYTGQDGASPPETVQCVCAMASPSLEQLLVAGLATLLFVLALSSTPAGASRVAREEAEAAAYGFTNAKISTCARHGRAAGMPWLTESIQAYICTPAQWDAHYDPATAIAYGLQSEHRGPPFVPAAIACPTPGQTIQCWIFASWGRVAGGPDACTDVCSTGEGEGEHSCCARVSHVHTPTHCYVAMCSPLPLSSHRQTTASATAATAPSPPRVGTLASIVLATMAPSDTCQKTWPQPTSAGPLRT
jgi:hypothetical protein